MKTVTLHGRKAAGRVALVDDEDYDLVARFRWMLLEDQRRSGRQSVPYARTRYTLNGRQMPVSMHALVTGWPMVDHINHDGLDNQRHNLRPVSNSQNLMNARPRGGTSAFKGVHWHRSSRKWVARIGLNNSRRGLGYFTDEEAAARAYDAAARELFGEFACLNFPEGAVKPSMDDWQRAWDATAPEREAFQARVLACAPVGNAERMARRVPEPRICAVCGATYFTRNPKPTLYCGTKCCRRAQTERDRAARNAVA